jgi:hypothetical protein
VRSIPHSSVFKVQTARINYGKMERVVKNEMKKNGKKMKKRGEYRFSEVSLERDFFSLSNVLNHKNKLIH